MIRNHVVTISPYSSSHRQSIDYIDVNIVPNELTNDIDQISYKLSIGDKCTCGEIQHRIVKQIAPSIKKELYEGLIWTDSSLPDLLSILSIIAETIDDNKEYIIDRLRIYTSIIDNSSIHQKIFDLFCIEVSVYLVINKLIVDGELQVPDFADLKDGFSSKLLTKRSMDILSMPYQNWLLDTNSLINKLGNICFGFTELFSSFFRESSENRISYDSNQGIRKAFSLTVEKINLIIASHNIEINTLISDNVKIVENLKNDINSLKSRIEVLESQSSTPNSSID